MGKKNTKGTQKENPLIDASIASPAYETALGMSNTEEVKNGKHDKKFDSHCCECVNEKYKKIRKRTRTWESIQNLYGDADTTEVWDNQELQPKAAFDSKLHENENPKAVIDKSEYNENIMYPTSSFKNKPAKLSLFSLYRKRKIKDNTIKIGHLNESSKETDVQYLPYTEPKTQTKKKPKKGLKDRNATGDICMDGPCREAIENLYNLQGLKYIPNTNVMFKKERVVKSGKNDKSKKERKKSKSPSRENKIDKKSKKKQIETVKATKEGNVGYGDQIPPTAFKEQVLKDVQTKCSFIRKIMGHAISKCKKKNNGPILPTSRNNTICTCKDNNERPLQTSIKPIICKCKKNEHVISTSNNLNNQTEDTLLEMKVNSTDMRVINSYEVNEKIRRLGRIEKNISCICPSRTRRLNNDKFCEKGLCENALKNKRTRFDCKCRKLNHIECKDSTCDLEIQDIKEKTRKRKRSRSPKYTKNNQPLLEVMLDANKMKIINSNEIEDVIRKTSQNNVICPTGICNTMSKQKKKQFKCKCVSKKLAPFNNECDERTCRRSEKKPSLFFLRSRVFSKSENWSKPEGNGKMRPIRGNVYGTKVKRDIIVKSQTHKRNGVMINLTRDQTPKKGTYIGETLSDVLYFCQKSLKAKKNKINVKKTKSKKKVSKRRRRRKGFFRGKKKDQRSLTEKILDCLDKEQELCENRIKRKTEAYKKNEKMAIKKNTRMVEQQKATSKHYQNHWNCFTNFIAGILNISFECGKIMFNIFFSVIGNPINSFIYVKEKIKNPRAAIIRIYEWFVRTWNNKSSIIANRIEESSTLNVIADQIEDSVIYDAIFAPKGRSRDEQLLYEKRTKMRKRRMQKRQDAALYGCRHMLLTTMRKTPCLWFYHICPDLYPQCLGLVSFMTNFLHIILYLVAIMCWTPCIVVCEMFRACMCCFFCTH